MTRGVGRITKKAWKNIRTRTGKTVRRYVGIDAKGRWKFLKTPKRGKGKTYKAASKSTSRRKSRGRSTVTRRAAFLSVSTVMRFARIGALLAPAAGTLLDPRIRGGYSKIERITALYTGYAMNDRKFHWEWLIRGWTPYVMTMLVTKGIGKLSGIIRRL